MQDQEVIDYIRGQYGIEPDHPFEKYPEITSFRHKDNRKWFGLIMLVSGVKLGLGTAAVIPVINLKIDDPVFRDMLIQQPGIIRAYHMNKNNWITIWLDGTLPNGLIFELIKKSYLLSAK